MTLISAYTIAQSQIDYKSRNSKLNTRSLSKSDKSIVLVAVNDGYSQRDTFDYKNRNQKFHKSRHDNFLLIEKERIVNDYRSFNHKFSKGQSFKFMNRLSREGQLTEK